MVLSLPALDHECHASTASDESLVCAWSISDGQDIGFCITDLARSYRFGSCAVSVIGSVLAARSNRLCPIFSSRSESRALQRQRSREKKKSPVGRCLSPETFLKPCLVRLPRHTTKPCRSERSHRMYPFLARARRACSKGSSIFRLGFAHVDEHSDRFIYELVTAVGVPDLAWNF